jgi:hypothetical protein
VKLKSESTQSDPRVPVLVLQKCALFYGPRRDTELNIVTRFVILKDLDSELDFKF